MSVQIGPFKTVLRLVVEHEFFADEFGNGLRWSPDAPTAGLLSGRHWAFRSASKELVVASDKVVDGASMSGPLRFLLWADDPTLAEVFEPFVFTPDRIVRLTGKQRQVEPDGRWRLHKQRTVARRNLAKPVQDALPSQALPAQRPLCEVVLDQALLIEAPTCVVRFAARQVHWTYHVTEIDGVGPLRLIDTGGKITFDDLGNAPLVTGFAARSFRSKTPLPLAERSPYRFQLRGRAERVLVRRLPGPGRSSAPIPGRRDGRLQTEIYVTL